MRILYIHQYFNTPSEPGGTRSYWIAKELINRGHEVVMLTSKSKVAKPIDRVNTDGIDVIYIANNYDNKLSPIQKVKSFVRFMFKAINIGSKEKGVDLIYATSTPLTVGVIALVLKFKKKWKYIFEVRDLWPEFPIQVGAIRNKFLICLLRKLEKIIYQKSEHVIALSPGMQDGVVSAGIPNEMVSMVPNMSKPDQFYPRKISKKIVDTYKIDIDKFNIIHFGSMGVANGLFYIVETAKILKKTGNQDINFIFLGAGATEQPLKDFVSENQLGNVQFLGKHSMDIVSEITNCCDLSVTSFMNLPILETNSPNKLFDSLSAGIPIVVNSAGWTKELVEVDNCGFYVDPDSPQDFADKLLKFKDDKELLRLWGENARKLSIEKFDKSILTAQVADIIEIVFENS